MDINTCSNVECLGSQFYEALPLHVPNKDKHTLPQLYKFGLNLIFPDPVVVKFILGGALG